MTDDISNMILPFDAYSTDNWVMFDTDFHSTSKQKKKLVTSVRTNKNGLMKFSRTVRIGFW